MKEGLVKVDIRFLRQGLVRAVVPEGFTKMTKKEKLDWAKHVLNHTKTDEELIQAMSDFEDPERDGWFDEDIPVCAIESVGGEPIVQTEEWKLFSSAEGMEIVEE